MDHQNAAPDEQADSVPCQSQGGLSPPGLTAAAPLPNRGSPTRPACECQSYDHLKPRRAHRKGTSGKPGVALGRLHDWREPSWPLRSAILDTLSNLVRKVVENWVPMSGDGGIQPVRLLNGRKSLCPAPTANTVAMFCCNVPKIFKRSNEE